eukprot:750497-Hanusia_phi.AAC.1
MGQMQMIKRGSCSARYSLLSHKNTKPAADVYRHTLTAEDNESGKMLKKGITPHSHRKKAIEESPPFRSSLSNFPEVAKKENESFSAPAYASSKFHEYAVKSIEVEKFPLDEVETRLKIEEEEEFFFQPADDSKSEQCKLEGTPSIQYVQGCLGAFVGFWLFYYKGRSLPRRFRFKSDGVSPYDPDSEALMKSSSGLAEDEDSNEQNGEILGEDNDMLYVEAPPLKPRWKTYTIDMSLLSSNVTSLFVLSHLSQRNRSLRRQDRNGFRQPPAIKDGLKVDTHCRVGIRNLGSTCFMNASLQLMANIEGFESVIFDSLDENDMSEKSEIAWQIASVISAIRNKSVDSRISAGLELVKRAGRLCIVPSRIVSLLDKLMTTGHVSGQQECAAEFLLYMINFVSQFKPVSQSLHKSMGINFKIHISSESMGMRNVKEEVDWMIHSPISGDTLEDCLTAYTRTESGLLVGDKNDGTQKTLVESCGEYLLICLKRFSFQQSSKSFTKERRSVSVPHSFDASAILEDGRSQPYELVGAIVHIGRGLESGHYVAYSRVDGNWLEINDEVVTIVETSELNKTLDEQAYILLYRQAHVKEVSEA